MLSKIILSFLFVVTVPFYLLGAEQHFTGFAGVNNFLDPMLIGDNYAQFAKNVITDQGDMRTVPGNILYSVVGGSSISFVSEFIDSSGKHNLISKTGMDIYSNNTLIYTLPVDRDIDMTVGFNTAYIVDGVVADAFSYDGSSTHSVTGFEDCRYVEYYQNRLACVNMSTDTAKIRFSAYNSSTSWVVTASKDSGAIKYFDKDDGYGINCVKTTPYGLFLGKTRSLQLLKGDNNETFYQVPLSNDIGCVEDRMVQTIDGEIVWLSEHGWYSSDGSNSPKPISLDIKGDTINIKQSLSGDSSLTVNTQSAWEAGSSTGPVWDYAITPGSIKTVTYNTGVSTFAQNSFAPGPVNAGFETGDGTGWSCDSYVVATGYYNFPCTVTSDTLSSTLAAYKYGTYWNSNAGAGTNTTNDFIFKVVKHNDVSHIENSVTIPSNCLTYGCDHCVDTTYTNIPSSYAVRVLVINENINDNTKMSTMTSNGFTTTSGIVSLRACFGYATASNPKSFFDMVESTGAPYLSPFSPVFDSGLSTVPYYTKDVQGSSVNVVLSYSADNVTFSTSAAANRYVKYQVQFSSGAGMTVSSFQYVTLSVFSTATYHSPVYHLGDNISAWKYFTVSDSATYLTTATFQVRTATYAFDGDGASPTWVNQIKNSIILADTSSYLQFNIAPNVHTSTENYKADTINIGYSTGELSPRGASVVANGRYIASISTVSSAENGLTLIWQRNKTWVPVADVSYGSLALFNGKPIAGDGKSTGKIWNIMEDTAYSFDGVKIDSFWVTKDFSLGQMNNHKVLDRFWISADNSGLNNFEIAWNADRTNVWNSTTTNLTSSNFIVKEVEGLFENQNIGRLIRFKFAGSELDKYFRLKLYSIYYTVNPLIKD